MRRFRSLYGRGPLHLLALVASLAIAGAAVVGWFDRPKDVGSVLIWFGAAIIIHDLVLLPLYSLLDWIAFGRSGGARLPAGVNWIPFVRIPAMLSGLLLLVFFPVIFGLGANTELSASGIPESGYLARWLLLTGVMFVVAGVAYAVEVGRGARGAVASGPPSPFPSPAAASATSAAEPAPPPEAPAEAPPAPPAEAPPAPPSAAFPELGADPADAHPTDADPGDADPADATPRDQAAPAPAPDQPRAV